MRALRIAGEVVVALTVIVIIIAGAVAIRGGHLAAWAIEHPISGWAGRQIHVDGPLTIQWGAATRIVAENVHVANARWGSMPEMFAAQRLEIDFRPMSLLAGPRHIPLITVDHARLLLETSRQGERNWDFALKFLAPRHRSQFPDLNQFLVRDGAFTFRNGQTGAETEMGASHLDVEAPDPTGPVKLAVDGTLQKQAMQLNGTVGPLAELRDPAKPYPLALDGTLGQSRLVIQGTMEKPLDVAGADMRLSLDGRKLHDIAAAFGIPLPPLPDFRGTGNLAGGNGDWRFNALSLTLGESAIAGGIAIDTRARVPYFRADLTASAIHLADFAGLLGAEPAHASAPPPPAMRTDKSDRIIPAMPIAVHRLDGLNADVSFDSTRVTTPFGLPIERIAFGLHLKDGVVTLNPLRLALAGGTAALDMRLDPAPQPPELALNLDVRHIDLYKLVHNAQVPPVLKETAGIAGGFAHLRSTGTSLRDFLGRMNGDAALFAENGRLSQLLLEIADLNVLQAVGLAVAGDKPVPVNCLVSRFNLRDGVATATTLLLDTTDTTVAGSGNVNFAAETIYVDLTPLHKSFTPLTLRTPVEIRGTFAAPTIRPSPSGIAARLGTALGLGVLFPPAALLPLIDTGLGEHNACGKASAAQKPARSVDTEKRDHREGASTPPR